MRAVTALVLSLLCAATAAIGVSRGAAPVLALATSGPEHLRTIEAFFDRAETLRGTFDDFFDQPRQAHPMRFVWDYWHVPDQYTLHRTQAADYFEAEDFQALTAALTAYGQEKLGCREISPPWLSYYIDGCEQQLHADVPQGPFAYVLSLTRWDERLFTGGETQIMQPFVLDYWRGFDSSTGLERSDLMIDVPPSFNQLTIFDARLPHGVRRVEGVRDPREARLVIHGWFCSPEPHFEGSLTELQATEGLRPSLSDIAEALAPPPVTGLLALRLDVAPDGTINGVTKLADTLVADPSALANWNAKEAPLSGPEEARRVVLETIEKYIREARFTPCDGPSTITVPFSFD